jgi:integrase
LLVKDADKKGLRLRVTKAGGKHWQFETRIKGKLFTRALGEWPAVSIDAAKAEAHRLRGLTESGTDPREIERQQAEVMAVERTATAEREAAAQVAAVTVAEVWAVYVAERHAHWGKRHYQDHVAKAAPGGVKFKRGTGTTEAGPLFPLMALTLRDLDAATIETWAAKEAKTRPTSARLAWRLLKGFLGWCNEQSAYAGLLTGNPAKTKKSREALGKPGVKSDVIEKGQLTAWFTAMQQLQNPVIAAYLQTVLLTGARPGEVMTLQWQDLNTQWKGITIRDKIEGERVIPLTPYVHHLIATLPKRNKWIFSSPTAKIGHLSEPTYPHTVACKAAGLDGLTLHGLRRSFKSLTEWLEIPAGVVAQLMGHKPSATAEKHYTVRPLDLLRVHHEKIEAWILEQAGIVFDVKAEPGKLQLVGKPA